MLLITIKHIVIFQKIREVEADIHENDLIMMNKILHKRD